MCLIKRKIIKKNNSDLLEKLQVNLAELRK